MTNDGQQQTNKKEHWRGTGVAARNKGWTGRSGAQQSPRVSQTPNQLLPPLSPINHTLYLQIR